MIHTRIYSLYKISVIVCIALTVLVLPRTASAMDDTILAIVNDELITLTDLRDYLETMYMQLRGTGKSKKELDAFMLQLEVNGIKQLIEDKLIISHADKMGLEVKESAVNERMEEIKKRYPSEQHFVHALVSNGSTITDLRNKITEQLKVKYVLDLEIRSKISIHPQEITTYYNKHIENFKKDERIRMKSIFIPKNGNEDPETVKKAQELLAELQEGVPFQEVAKKLAYSPTESIVEKGQMLPEIEEAIFQLGIGQNSPTIETGMGVYIFKMLERIPPSAQPVAEVSEKIEKILFQQKFKERYTQWMDKLKENAYIEIKS